MLQDFDIKEGLALIAQVKMPRKKFRLQSTRKDASKKKKRLRFRAIMHWFHDQPRGASKAVMEKMYRELDSFLQANSHIELTLAQCSAVVYHDGYTVGKVSSNVYRHLMYTLQRHYRGSEEDYLG